jgi:TolB-like protein/cytochrome c-type biogenesis protein CcmH/NrfG
LCLNGACQTIQTMRSWGVKVQFYFDNHKLDADRRELHRGSNHVAVEPQVFDLLMYLVKNRDRVVSKDDLIASVWGGRNVSDSTLSSRMNAARRAIGDNGDEQRLIRTVPRRGVRFVGEVSTAPVQSGATPAPGPRTPAIRSNRPAVAVLPFVNVSGEPDQDYFADGISEDIITALSKVRWFLVIARNSSFAYKGSPINTKRVGEELGINYLIEGSVRKSGDRVRITAQLNDTAIGNQLWSERYDRQLAGVFDVQDEITEAVVAAIEPQIYAAENFRARRKAPENLDAWGLVMRALSHYWSVTREDNLKAQEFLEQAIAIDSNYAQALAVLAVCHTFGAHMGWEDVPTAVSIAERTGLAAVQADSEDPWAHLGLATAYVYLRRFEDSLAEFELALRLNPNFALAQGYYGLGLSYVGRWQEGSEAARHALRLSPRDPFSAIYNGVAAYAEFVGRNYNEAMRLAREAIRQRADFVSAYRLLAAAAAMKGDNDLAKAMIQEVRRLQPDITLAWMARQMPVSEAQREHYVEALRRAGLD